MAKSLLPGYPNCNEKLPVGTISETYYFYQFMPIEKEAAGKTVRMGVPIQVANPKFIGEVQERFGASAPSVLANLKGDIEAFDPSWMNVVIAPPEPPVEVIVEDVPGLLVSGILTVGQENYDIASLSEIQQKLGKGEPVVTRLTSGTTTRTFRLVPMVSKGCDIPERIRVDSLSISTLHKSGNIYLPGLGTAKASLSTESAKELLLNGFATVDVDIPGAAATRKLLVEVDQGPGTADADALRSLRIARMTPIGSRLRPADDTRIPVLNPEWVIYTPIVQTWEGTGYERGALINTFSLAPQEQITVEVFSWDRRTKTSELSSSRENEASVEDSFSQKVTSEALNEAKNTNGWEFGANAGFEVPQIALKVGADFSIKDINEILQKNTLQKISEGVTKAATKIKSSIQTKVTESQESGREERITRRFQNPNTGRILHLDCFEVVSTYRVTTRYDFANAKLCVLLPCIDFLQNLANPSTRIRATALLALEGLLYEQVPARLQGGFDSARLVLAWDRICDYACDSVCACDKPDGGNSTGNQGAPAAGNPYAVELDAAMFAFKEVINRVRSASGDPLANTMGIPRTPPGYLDRSDEEKAALRRGFHTYLYKKLVLESLTSSFWNACIDFVNAPTHANAQAVVEGATPQIVNLLNGAIAYASVGVAAIRQLIEFLGEFGLNTPFMLAYLGFDDHGLETAFQNLRRTYEAWKKVEDDKKHPPEKTEDPAQSPPPPARRTDEVAFSPESLATASVNIDALVDFINMNRSMFRTLIWNTLNPSDRMRFLGFFGDVGRFTTPRVLGFVQDNMAVEVTSSVAIEVESWIRDRLLKIAGQTLSVEDVTLPVPGMTMQSRLENCDALEPYLTESRQIELARIRSLADQEAAEARRLKQRVDTGNLGDPNPKGPLLVVEKAPAP